MSKTYDDFLPLFGHCKDFSIGDEPDETGLDFVRFALANLAGCHPKTLAEFTGDQASTRYEILYNKVKEQFFDFFQVYESRENSAFGLLDDSYMAEFLILLKRKGLIRMPKTESEYQQKIFKELGLLDSADELMVARRPGRPRKVKMEEDELPSTPRKSHRKPAKESSKGNGTEALKRPGRPPSNHLEAIDLTRPIKLGPKQASGKAAVAAAIQDMLASFGKKKVTSEDLILALVKDKWGTAQARTSIIRLIRGHEYLDYA